MSYSPDSFDINSYDPNSFDFGEDGPGPDPFVLADENNVPLSTLITSGAITITGLGAAGDISVAGSGAEYNINGGAWTSAPGVGVVNNGNLIRVRATSSGVNSTAINIVLTINEVSDTWTITTLAASASGWNRGIVGNEIGFNYLIPGLGVVGTLGISTHE